MVNPRASVRIGTNADGYVQFQPSDYFDACTHVRTADLFGHADVCLSVDQLKAMRDELDIRIAIAEGAFV